MLLFCLFGFFCVWFYPFRWWAFGIGTFRVLRVEYFTRLTIIKFQFCLTLRTILLSTITAIKLIKINRALTLFTTQDKICGSTLFIGTCSYRSQWCWCKMKIWWSTKWTWTILKSLMAKLTAVKITVIKMVILCSSATFWARNILLVGFAVNAFKSLT